MRPDTITTDREPARTEQAPRDQRARTAPHGEAPGPGGPLSGIERAAFFAALRRKADQRLAEFG